MYRLKQARIMFYIGLQLEGTGGIFPRKKNLKIRETITLILIKNTRSEVHRPTSIKHCNKFLQTRVFKMDFHLWWGFKEKEPIEFGFWHSSKVWFPALKAFSWFWLLDPSKSRGIKKFENFVGNHHMTSSRFESRKLGLTKVGQFWEKMRKLFWENYKTTILFTNSWIQIFENESF